MSANSLIFRLKRGDKKALEEIYRKYRLSFVNWITFAHQCSHDRAVDIFQYSILSFYENVVDGSVEEMNDAGIKTYLFSIGKNKFLSDNRREAKMSYQEELEEYGLDEIQIPNDDIKEKRAFLSNVLNNLGSPCSDILRLFYFNNLSADEIAEVMNYKNGNTVKNLKYKCLQRIKKAVNTDEKHGNN
jgi:RNA polymerase sigma-70 factor (ECF subfamily)